MKQWVMALLTLWVGIAQAEVGGKMELELSAEKRISSLVYRYDPWAIVRVNISLKTISSPLPGTGLEVNNFSNSSSLRSDEIRSTTVTILTSKDDFPEWLKSEVSALVSGLRPSIDVKPLSDDAKAVLLSGNGSTQGAMGLDKSMTQIQVALKDVSLNFGIALVAVLLICLMGGAAVAFALQKRGAKEINRLVEARLIPVLQNMGSQASESQGSRPTVLQATLSAPVGGFGSSGGGNRESSGAAPDVAALSPESVEALITDCYWTHRDSYAAWLWSVMTPVQRTALLSSSKLDSTYLKSVQVFPKERSEDHLDPAYLKPLAIGHLSQEDLARWVESFRPGFHLLPPMRQATLPISFKLRLDCLAEPLDAKLKIPPLPERPSTKRTLLAVQRIGDLSLDDEATILHNPSMVPEAMKPYVRSLVWLALNPFEKRQKVLAEFSAEELATAWGGAPEVLSRLSEALPEKKRAMLESYRSTIEVNRKAGTFNKLVDLGLGQGMGATSTPQLKVA